MSMVATPFMVQEMLAQRLYIAKDDDVSVIAENAVSIEVLMLGVPDRGKDGAKYFVKLEFVNLPTVSEAYTYLNIGVIMVNEGGFFLKWNIEQASAFVTRMLLKFKTISVTMRIESAGEQSKQWSKSRRDTLHDRFNAISLANMVAKANAYTAQANDTVNVKTQAKKIKLRRLAANLREAAYFGDYARNGFSGVEYEPRSVENNPGWRIGYE
jgi:hypothetical protein